MLLDLLTIEPHTPTPEPMGYEKKDGQWYTHDGVDVKDTQQRKGSCSCSSGGSIVENMLVLSLFIAVGPLILK